MHEAGQKFIPQKYCNENDLGAIANYVFQGKNSTRDKNIQILGNQILKRMGRYDAKIKDTNLLLKSRKRFLLFIAVVILTIAYMTSTFSHKKVENRLYGYWNMVLDSLVINRNTKIEFSSINFNFSNKNVELPLLRTPEMDLKGKTLLDEDIDEDSLKKIGIIIKSL